VDQTDFRKVTFGRVKKTLPARKVAQWRMLSVQGATVNIQACLNKIIAISTISKNI